jgi:hypothetical protein
LLHALYGKIFMSVQPDGPSHDNRSAQSDSLRFRKRRRGEAIHEIVSAAYEIRHSRQQRNKIYADVFVIAR